MSFIDLNSCLRVSQLLSLVVELNRLEVEDGLPPSSVE